MRKKKGPYENIWFEYCETWLYDRQGNVKWEIPDPDTSMLRPKFYDLDADPKELQYTHNKGKYLSFNHSTWGRKKYFYQQGGKWYVLFSLSKIKSYKNNIYHIKELNIGASDRILIRNKPWLKAK